MKIKKIKKQTNKQTNKNKTHTQARKKDKIKNNNKKVIGIGCHLLIYFWFLIVSVLLTSNSMFLVLYIIVFKYSIFNLLLDLELYM